MWGKSLQMNLLVFSPAASLEAQGTRMAFLSDVSSVRRGDFLDAEGEDKRTYGLSCLSWAQRLSMCAQFKEKFVSQLRAWET